VQTTSDEEVAMSRLKNEAAPFAGGSSGIGLAQRFLWGGSGIMAQTPQAPWPRVAT
jgi:hypothetical protein